MAGYENIKNKGFDHRSTRELREIQSRGGKASGEARRKRADFRNTLSQLLTTEINDSEWVPVLESLGIKNTLESAVNMAMIKRALAGDVRAYEAVAKYSGQRAGTDEDLEEQKIRTERARRARDQEVGDTDSADENIRSFLKAMNPTPEDIESLFEEEVGEDAEETEETGKV